MADITQAPVNGTYAAPPNHYPDTYLSHTTMNNTGASYHPGPASTPSNGPGPENKNEIPKDEVGWYFVEQYYTTMSRAPEKLHLFYNRRSQFVSGDEAESVPVVVGQKDINDKIKELDFQDCKVRVLNVDSQASFDNILVAVIGEISNRSEPSRKFTQTFVLAQQPNGYYVLNDIFRYLADDDEEFVPGEEPAAAAEPAVSPAPETTVVPEEEEAAPETEETPVLENSEETASEVDTKIEPVATNGEVEKAEEPAAPVQVNGDAVHEKPAVPITPAVPAVSTEPEAIKSDKPKTPEPTLVVSTPKETAPVVKKETVPPAKVVPTTWATIASNRAAAAAAAAAKANAAVATPTAAAPQPKAATPATSSQQQVQPQQEQPTAAAATAAPTEAVATSSQAVSNDGAGWQTAGADHGKKQSRAEEKYPAYIKNVTDKVDASLLRAVLSRFGKLAHFDVNRQRNCAFVDFADQAAYNAAVAANPHQIGTEQVTVEERRVRSGNVGGGFAAGRGGNGANRGRADGRAGSQGRGGNGFQREQGRGGFALRGRGGNVSNSKRSQPQAA